MRFKTRKEIERIIEEKLFVLVPIEDKNGDRTVFHARVEIRELLGKMMDLLGIAAIHKEPFKIVKKPKKGGMK